MTDVWPVTIIRLRYGTAYSGAKWLAFNDGHLNDATGDNITCATFFRTYDGPIGRGEVPQEAYDDLVRQLDLTPRRVEEHRADRLKAEADVDAEDDKSNPDEAPHRDLCADAPDITEVAEAVTERLMLRLNRDLGGVLAEIRDALVRLEERECSATTSGLTADQQARAEALYAATKLAGSGVIRKEQVPAYVQSYVSLILRGR